MRRRGYWDWLGGGLGDDDDDDGDDDDGDGSIGRRRRRRRGRRRRRLALLKLNEEELSVLEGWCELEIDDDGEMRGDGMHSGCRGATPDHDDAPDCLRSIFSFR